MVVVLPPPGPDLEALAASRRAFLREIWRRGYEWLDRVTSKVNTPLVILAVLAAPTFGVYQLLGALEAAIAALLLLGVVFAEGAFDLVRAANTQVKQGKARIGELEGGLEALTERVVLWERLRAVSREWSQVHNATGENFGKPWDDGPHVHRLPPEERQTWEQWAHGRLVEMTGLVIEALQDHGHGELVAEFESFRSNIPSDFRDATAVGFQAVSFEFMELLRRLQSPFSDLFRDFPQILQINAAS